MAESTETVRRPRSWRKNEYGPLKRLSTWDNILKEFILHKLLAPSLDIGITLVFLVGFTIILLNFSDFHQILFNISFLSLTLGSILLAFKSKFSFEHLPNFTEYNLDRAAFDFLYGGLMVLLFYISALILSSLSVIPETITPQMLADNVTGILFWSAYAFFFFMLLPSSLLSTAISNTFFVLFSSNFLGFQQESPPAPQGPVKYYWNQLRNK